MPPSQPLFLHLAHVKNFNDDIYVTLVLVLFTSRWFLTSEQKPDGREDGQVVVYLNMYWSGGLLWVYTLHSPEMEITKNKNT